MNKTYLIDEEVLRQVLDALDIGFDNNIYGVKHNDVCDVSNALRAILASPPAEPVAWIKKTDSSDIWQQEPKHPESFIPLYRKDCDD